MARPLINVDKELFEEACSLYCTKPEVARLCRCSEDTIDRWVKREYGESFAVVQEKYSEQGKMSLRRNQLRLSETNATMAIWLGKQWLGQKDRQEDGTDAVKLIIERKVIDLTDGEDENNKL